MLLFHVLAALRNGKPLAVEIDALDARNRAWVGVYPLDAVRDERLLAARGWGRDGERACRVRAFEVRRERIDADVWLAESDLANREDCLATETTLPNVLARVGARVEQLEGLWRAGYPI